MSYSQLDRPVQFLKGVGPRRAEGFARLGITTARDLLYHVPRRYDDASTLTPVGSLRVGMDVTVVGTVRTKGVIPTRRGLRIFQAVLEDDSGLVTVAWPGRPWLDRKIRVGDVVLASGRVKFVHGLQLQPREFTILGRQGDAAERTGTIFVSYPASEEIPQWVLRRVFAANLDQLLAWAEGEEYLPEAFRAELGLPTVADALRALHRPSSLADAEAGRRRLAFDELFGLQLMQALARHRMRSRTVGIAHARTNELLKPLHAALPFRLTSAQVRVLREITADMSSPHRMNRLLQGDVGSGKTVVALFAMLLAVEGGHQAALMAPTEILAEQHARTLDTLLEPLGMRVLLLTGSLSAAERRRAHEDIAAGAPLVVGTHALIQEGVRFRSLGLVVVDEQHRFGVRQRLALAEGGEGDAPSPDVLVMSATPIPRSLAMALYGDLDLSVLDELPPGRKPVRTEIRPPSVRRRVYEMLAEEMRAGRQAYVVYPLVSESDKMDLRSATEEFERLQRSVFPDFKLGLLHGQLAAEEKDRVMRAFVAGEIQLLVATTVIEVGIDVPNATVMVIEHPERFGLSQLHQLRGRVGRGAAESRCILIADADEDAGARLRVFCETADGFALATADLRLRGQGDFFGARQHGAPALRYADLLLDEDLLREAQARARGIVAEDPELQEPGHAAIRSWLLSRFGDRLALYGVG